MTNDQRPNNTAANSAFAGIAIRDDLRGAPYINWLRCSGISQTDTSPDGQKEVNDAYCAIQQMNWAGYDVYAEAVSGSQTFNREDLHEILELKRTRNDFTKVIVFELSRATRGGIRHGNVVEDELRKAGIELISSTELIPDGPIGDLIKAVKHFSNQQQAHNGSKSVARGLAQSLAKASRPASGRTPLGLDRLYLGPDGSRRTLIRWEGPTQVRLDPNTFEVISRAERQPPRKPRKKGEKRRTERRQRFVGYKKQDDETSLFVPGSESARQCVCDILRMYHLDKLGAHRIIQELRAGGTLSPEGTDWNMSSIRNIVENPIYIGKEVRHRWTKALYHKLGPDGPIPVFVDQDLLQAQGRKSVPMTERPRDEWVLVDKPMLKDFLPPDLRAAALAHLTKLYDVDAITAKQAKKSKRKHKCDDNEYVLAQLLTSKQTDHPMRGDTHRRERASGEIHVVRNYFDYSTASKAVSGLHARRVPAVPLEDGVIPPVFDVLMDQRWIEGCVRDYVKSTSGRMRDVEAERRNLIDEREEIGRRLKRVHKTSGHLTDEELEVIVADDTARIVAIRRELADLDQQDEHRPPTADEAIAAVTARLTALPADWRSLPNRELKEFLATVVEHLEVDLKTFAVKMSVVLPAAAFNELPDVEDVAGGRVNFRSLRPSEPDSTAFPPLKIAEVTCEHDQTTKCYTCKRRRQAP